jgi:hypothetical protein
MSINELKTNTEHFLRNNLVTIAGGGSGAVSEPGKAYFSMETAGVSPGLRITKLLGKKEGANIFEAWYIPMQQIGSFTARKLPTTAEESPGIMLTSQITGCMFAVGRDGNSTTVAHIQPDQTSHRNVMKLFPDAPKGASFNPEAVKAVSDLRQSDMRMAARVQGLTTAVAHAGYYADKAASVAYDRGKREAVAVVGIRDDKGQWSIYSQLSADQKVIDVKRI